MKALADALAVVGLSAAAGFIACGFLQPLPYVIWPIWGVAIVSMSAAIVVNGKRF